MVKLWQGNLWHNKQINLTFKMYFIQSLIFLINLRQDLQRQSESTIICSYNLIHTLNCLLYRTYLTQRGKCRGAITPRRPILAHAVRYCLYSSACSMRQPVAGSNVARSHARANCSFSWAACWCACCCCWYCWGVWATASVTGVATAGCGAPITTPAEQVHN